MRIVALWSGLTTYTKACLDDLVSGGHELIFIYDGIPTNIDKTKEAFLPRASFTSSLNLLSSNEIQDLIKSFNPDFILINGWHHPKYNKAIKLFKGRRILMTDALYKGTLRQFIAICLRRILISPYFDYAFVPGKKQEKFMNLLGFKNRTYLGSLTADTKTFYNKTNAEVDPRSFLYVGRLSPEKGLADLIAGYRLYRDRFANQSWKLNIIGSGPMISVLERVDGVAYEGFKYPVELLESYSKATVFIMPSRSEAWGVAIHEACICGLPIIATEVCGTSGHLIIQDTNGVLVEPNKPQELANAMVSFHEMSSQRIDEMGKASQELAKNYSVTKWTTTVLLIASRIQEVRHGG